MADKIKYQFNNDLPILKKDWKGNIVINGQFQNDEIPAKPPLKDVLKWKFSRNPQKKEKQQDTFKLTSVPLQAIDRAIDQIIWLGHAAFLMVINGITILTDPCFSDIPTAKRLVDLPCDIELLNKIDYLLLSHDHRDHFDVKSIKRLVEINPNMEILAPLNFKQLLSKNKISTNKVQEAGWYQPYQTDKSLEIIFLPTHHWGRRGLNDFNKALWGSFLIKTPTQKIFFSGDTAYSEVFKEINKDFGDFDICLMPIGAYAPSFMMKDSHTTPEEACQVFNDLGGKTFVPMHFGTYDLSDEPLGEPIRRLHKCFDNDESRLRVLEVGEKYEM